MLISARAQSLSAAFITSEHALRLLYGVGLNDLIQIVIVRGEEDVGESGCGTGACPKESSTKESASSSPKKRPRAETAGKDQWKFLGTLNNALIVFS